MPYCYYSGEEVIDILKVREVGGMRVIKGREVGDVWKEGRY